MAKIGWTMAITRRATDTLRVAELEAFERGQAAWPAVNLSRATFVAHLASVGATTEHAADLFLALGCAVGDRAAIALFEQHYVREVPRYIARIDSSPSLADEIKQLLRDYVLVAKHGSRPHIADYSGRGPLGAWVRIIACRYALQHKRKAARLVDSDIDLATRLSAADPSPEVALVRARHGPELAAALRAAVASLSDKARGLIKLSIVDGLTIDDLSGMYGVHRGTVARWLVRLKEQLFEAAVDQLRDQLRLDTEGVESLYRAVRSQLDFSIGGLLEPRSS